MIQLITPDALKEAGVKPTMEPSLEIENFEGDWKKEWFTYRPQKWARTTNKLFDPVWKAPKNAALELKITSVEANTLVVQIDSHAAATVNLKGSPDVQTVALQAADFTNVANEPLSNWDGIYSLTLTDSAKLRKGKETKDVGSPWKGKPPVFDHLRWVEGN